MLYTKDGYPEVNDIVVCTVKKIYGNSTFVYLTEYEKEGILTISEIAAGRIRNLRDHVVEDKTIICKVLRVNEKQKRIEVSLRRVPLPVMKNKLEEIKKEEYAERMYNDLAEEFKTTKDDLFERTYEPIFEEYNTVYDGLYDVMINNNKIDMFTKLSNEEKQAFLQIINVRIKPESVTLKKKFKLSSMDSEGIEVIKNTIGTIVESINYDRLNIFYTAAGEFEIDIVHDDLKSADKLFTKFKEELEKVSKINNLEVKF